jgi:hypothetical protein
MDSPWRLAIDDHVIAAGYRDNGPGNPTAIGVYILPHSGHLSAAARSFGSAGVTLMTLVTCRVEAAGQGAGVLIAIGSESDPWLGSPPGAVKSLTMTSPGCVSARACAFALTRIDEAAITTSPAIRAMDLRTSDHPSSILADLDQIGALP